MSDRETRPPSLVDLHLHTHYSDGELPPQDVVGHMARLGRVAVAITDHDTVEGIDEALEAGARLGVEVVPGTELSTCLGKFRDLHLLGYFIDSRDPSLRTTLREFQEARRRRAAAIVERVNALLAKQQKMPLAFDDIARPLRGTIARPHIARELVARGMARHVDHAFQEYLIPCNVPKRYFSPEEACSLIAGAGGLTVLAHPKLIPATEEELEELIATLQGMGLQGIEVSYGEEDPPFESFLTSLGHRHGLLLTGGSDFHGEHHLYLARHGPGLRAIPYSLFEKIKAAHATSRGRG